MIPDPVLLGYSGPEDKSEDEAEADVVDWMHGVELSLFPSDPSYIGGRGALSLLSRQAF